MAAVVPVLDVKQLAGNKGHAELASIDVPPDGRPYSDVPILCARTGYKLCHTAFVELRL